MKQFLLTLMLTVVASCQAVITQGTPASAAVPTKLVANSPDGSIKLTLTGDTFPAKNITYNWTLQGVTLAPFTIPVGVVTAFTFQFNQGTNAATVIVSLTPGTNGAAVQATVNGGTAVTGTF